MPKGSFDLKAWARIGAERRLEEIREEKRVIAATFPDLRVSGESPFPRASGTSMAAHVSAARRAVCAGVMILVAATGAKAQVGAPATQMVHVEERVMRVAVAGLQQRKLGQPVVILEAGANETGIETWTPVFAALARVAPVLAYDRRGVGKSEPDIVKPTLRRTAQSLHALLQRLRISPPYILVGQSWGGVVTRAYFDQYAQEVAGMVFLDAVNPGRTREERAKSVPPEEERAAVLAPPDLPAIPPDTPPGLRAEYELVLSEMANDFPEARSLRLPTGVPVVVVRASPPGRKLGVIELDETELAGLALRSPKGLYLAAAHVGHHVHRDDPGLVVYLVEHVLRYAVTAPKAQ